MTGKYFIDGEQHAAEPFVYRVSGLDDVVLLNGFCREDTDYGPGVAIDNVDGLHFAIAINVISTRKALTPKEFRFLRHEMEKTQNELGGDIGVDGQTIARYEKGETKIPGPVDRLVRLVFVLGLMPPEEQQVVLKRIRSAIEGDERVNLRSAFQEIDGAWSEAGIAA